LIKPAETVDPVMLAKFCRELVSRLGGDEDSEEAAQRRYAGRWNVGAVPTGGDIDIDRARAVGRMTHRPAVL
jgi:hypothetical protein